MSFKSYRSYWNFKINVQNKTRYILDEESKEFLEAIKDTCKSRIKTIKKDALLYRAQVGCDLKPYYQTNPDTDEEVHVDDIEIPFRNERMKPLKNQASEGRANPKGIPYLYVASNKETAMSEVRPSKASTISVAKLSSSRDLQIIDFSIHEGKINFFLKEPSNEKKIEAVWTDIDNAFSRPLSNTNFNSDYIPTQIIAEYIKSLGYDGIAYKSSLGNGYNITLFDINSADIISCDIYNVKDINYSFERIENQFT